MSSKQFDWFAAPTILKGVGSKIVEKLQKLAIMQVGDLLLHCPSRYEDRTRLTPIKDCQPDQSVLIQGHIIQVKEIKSRKKRCIVTLGDKSSFINLVFFHYYGPQLKQWQVGVVLRCFGQVVVKEGLQIIHPEYEVIAEDNPSLLPPYLTPIYPTVAGLSQNWLRRTITTVLEQYKAAVITGDRWATHEILLGEKLSCSQALDIIHRPTPAMDVEALCSRSHPAYLRLIREELLAHHLSLQRIREEAQARAAVPLHLTDHLLAQFLQRLPFMLTTAQERVWQQIRADLAKEVPMLRLVQGDVGCGKTIVAALAALATIASHKQVAIMAPTEILAEQHFVHFTNWFEALGFRTELLTSKLKAKAKRSVYENITLGLTDIIIGTQALFQDNVQFKALHLVIIDEQHRFGVHQRLALQVKGHSALTPTHPHQLIMTATPIPRTLAMSHYAHLDISVIDALPPGRQPIATLTISQSRRHEIIERIARVCETGQQIYWVCTLIEGSENLDCQAAEIAAQELQVLLPKYRIGLVHGKLDPLDKELVMRAFYQGEISVLVATTVIEVGVNVPNATLMVIENPERLGLAQLHQLRGRVGRGQQQSFCVLLYQNPLSEMAQARLRILRESTDGFVIAEADLELRGPGEVLGVRQTGGIQFKIADLKRDKEILKNIISQRDTLNSLTLLQSEMIIKRWCPGNHYSQA